MRNDQRNVKAEDQDHDEFQRERPIRTDNVIAVDDVVDHVGDDGPGRHIDGDRRDLHGAQPRRGERDNHDLVLEHLRSDLLVDDVEV